MSPNCAVVPFVQSSPRCTVRMPMRMSGRFGKWRTALADVRLWPNSVVGEWLRTTYSVEKTHSLFPVDFRQLTNDTDNRLDGGHRSDFFNRIDPKQPFRADAAIAS